MEKQNNKNTISNLDGIEESPKYKEALNTWFKALKTKLSKYKYIRNTPFVANLRFTRNKDKTLIRKLTFYICNQKLGIGAKNGRFVFFYSNTPVLEVNPETVWSDILLNIIEDAALKLVVRESQQINE